MFKYFYSKKSVLFQRAVCSVVAFAFLLSLAIPSSIAQLLPAGSVAGLPNLPAPGQMIGLTPVFEPAILRGMTIYPDNPLAFDFIVDRGQDKLGNDELKLESEKLIKYFLASMTIPDKEAWVNLSPYEKNRIIPDALGQTEMGRQMLEQDYILKQISASLTNPDKELGQKFWNEVKTRAQQQFGVSEIPLSTFNKVWIVPGSATVVEKDGFAYITESKLNVMLDQDYVAEQNNMSSPKASIGDPQSTNGFPTRTLGNDKLSNLSTEVFREMILPKLVEEVNAGRNFSQTRQVYQSVILATWYKRTLKDSLLGRIYADKSKVQGVETDDKDIKQKVYDQYIAAFKQGAYNIIKEESGSDGDLIPRKYFSGGTIMDVSPELKVSHDPSQIQEARIAIIAGAAANDIALVGGSFVEASTGEVSAVIKAATSSSSPIEEEMRSAQRRSDALSREVDGILSDAVASLERSVNKPQVDVREETKKLSERLNAASRQQESLESRLYLVRSMSSYLTYWGGLRESSFKISIIRNLLQLSAEQTQNRVAAFENEYTRLRSNGFLNVEIRKRLDIIILRLTNRLTGGVSPEEMAKLINAKFEQLFPLNRSVNAKDVFTALAWDFIYQLGSNPNDDDLNTMMSRVRPFSVSLKQSGLTSAAVRKIMIDDFKYDDGFRLKAPLGIIEAFKDLSSQFNPSKSSSSTVVETPNRPNMPLVENTGINLSNLNAGRVNSSDIYIARWNSKTVAVKIDRTGRSPEADAEMLIDLWPYGGLEYYGMVRIKVGAQELVGVAMEVIEGMDMSSLATQKGKPLFPITDAHIQSIKALRTKLQADRKSFDDIKSGEFVLTPNGRVRPINMRIDNVNTTKNQLFDQIILWLEENKDKINTGNISTSTNTRNSSSSPVGGIDFDPSKLNLQIKRDGHGVALPLIQQDLLNIDIKGLQPIIIKIQPVNLQTLPILGQLNAQPQAVDFSKG